VLAALRPLLGYDVRHSQQVRAGRGQGGCLAHTCVRAGWGGVGWLGSRGGQGWVLAQTLSPGGHLFWPKNCWAQAAGAGSLCLARATAAAATPSACLPACLLQKCQLQCGVPLEHSGRLAAHTTDECKKYAGSNSSYEADAAGAPIKLVGGCAGAAAGSQASSAGSLKTLASWPPQTRDAWCKPLKIVSNLCQNALKTLSSPSKRRRMAGVPRGL